MKFSPGHENYRNLLVLHFIGHGYIGKQYITDLNMCPRSTLKTRQGTSLTGRAKLPGRYFIII